MRTFHSLRIKQCVCVFSPYGRENDSKFIYICDFSETDVLIGPSVAKLLKN